MRILGLKFLGIKQLVVIGLLAATIPFWLPTFLGGVASYHFVLTDSMKGSVDPGSFVVLHQSDSYQVGNVVGFRQEIDEDHGVTILHRIVSKSPDAQYMIKGDATSVVEKVGEEAITGRMVLSIPYLGFLPGAFGQYPQLIVVALLAFLLLPGLSSNGSPVQKSRRGLLFALALLVILVTFPFAEIGPAAFLGKTLLFIILFGFLAVTKLADSVVPKRQVSSLVETNYLLVMALAVSSLPLQKMVEDARGRVGL